MHGRTSSSPRPPSSASSRPVSPFAPPAAPQAHSTTHSRAHSLQPVLMSRRPSFPALQRDENSCLVPIEPGAGLADEKRASKRKSLSLAGVGAQDSSIKIDWSATASTFAPLVPNQGKDKEDAKGGYLQLAMDDISPVSN